MKNLSSALAALAFSLCAAPLLAQAAPPLMVDGDNDGVSDEVDDCPYTPPNTPVDSHGCPVSHDADGDGVPDDVDDCPYTPPGARVDAHGCALDGDLDGVPDGIDLCPHSTFGERVDAHGCEEGAVPPPLPSSPRSRSEAPASMTKREAASPGSRSMAMPAADDAGPLATPENPEPEPPAPASDRRTRTDRTSRADRAGRPGRMIVPQAAAAVTITVPSEDFRAPDHAAAPKASATPLPEPRVMTAPEPSPVPSPIPVSTQIPSVPTRAATAVTAAPSDTQPPAAARMPRPVPSTRSGTIRSEAAPPTGATVDASPAVTAPSPIATSTEPATADTPLTRSAPSSSSSSSSSSADPRVVVQFKRNSVEIPEADLRRLLGIVEELKSRFDRLGDGPVTVSGFRKVGERADLSRQRADIVRIYLVANGLPEAGVQAVDAGVSRVSGTTGLTAAVQLPPSR